MSDGVDKAFEARVIAHLDQQKAELKSLQILATGTLVTIALIGLGLAIIGKGLEK